MHLTRIYTQIGDDGTTGLGDFSRVRKTDVRLEAYADIDEMQRVARHGAGTRRPGRGGVRIVRKVQNDLFDVGADLCTPIVPRTRSTRRCG